MPKKYKSCSAIISREKCSHVKRNISKYRPSFLHAFPKHLVLVTARGRNKLDTLLILFSCTFVFLMCALLTFQYLNQLVQAHRTKSQVWARARVLPNQGLQLPLLKSMIQPKYNIKLLLISHRSRISSHKTMWPLLYSGKVYLCIPK